MKKRGITFIGLSNQESTGTELRIAANTVHQATDHKGWVQTSFAKDIGNQAGGSRFAVCTGYRNTMAIAHQFREHFCARHDRYAGFSCGDHLRVAFIDGTGTHYHISSTDICGAMSDEHFNTSVTQALSDRTLPQIGTGHLIPQINQYLGNATHARAAHTNHVNAANAAHFGDCVNVLIERHRSAPPLHRPLAV